MSKYTDLDPRGKWPVEDMSYVATVSGSLVKIVFTNGYQIDHDTAHSLSSRAVDVFQTGVWRGEFRFLTDLSIEGLAQYLRSYLLQSPTHFLHVAEEVPHVSPSN